MPYSTNLWHKYTEKADFLKQDMLTKIPVFSSHAQMSKLDDLYQASLRVVASLFQRSETGDGGVGWSTTGLSPLYISLLSVCFHGKLKFL